MYGTAKKSSYAGSASMVTSKDLAYLAYLAYPAYLAYSAYLAYLAYPASPAYKKRLSQKHRLLAQPFSAR